MCVIKHWFGVGMAGRINGKEYSIEYLEPFWDFLTEAQQNEVKGVYRIQKFKKNQIIYKEGEPPSGLFCLVKGKVKIFKEGVGGRGQIVRMVKPIGFFGYRALFAEENYITSSITIEESYVLTIPSEILLRFLREKSNLAMYFIRTLAIELGQSNQQTVSLTQKHIRGRLAEALVFLRDTYGLEEDGATISVYLSREDLASLSNMTTSNAIRTLSNFANERIITIDGRKVKIINEEILRRISLLG